LGERGGARPRRCHASHAGTRAGAAPGVHTVEGRGRAPGPGRKGAREPRRRGSGRRAQGAGGRAQGPGSRRRELGGHAQGGGGGPRRRGPRPPRGRAGTAREGSGGHRAGAVGGRARGAAGGAHTWERKEGAHREGQGRERKIEREEKRGEGGSPRGSNSGDHHLQNLGHHGERERWERERLLRGRNQMREKGPGGRAGRAGPGWAGPHRGSKPRDTHNHRSEINSRSKIRNGTKQRTRLSTESDKEI
jgi:hypothetical protein